MPKPKARKKRSPKRVLALADLERATTAVLNSLRSVSGQRTYDHAIREFAWYCSEPRLAFNRKPHCFGCVARSATTADRNFVLSSGRFGPPHASRRIEGDDPWACVGLPYDRWMSDPRTRPNQFRHPTRERTRPLDAARHSVHRHREHSRQRAKVARSPSDVSKMMS
jgi:hypothetical protein